MIRQTALILISVLIVLSCTSRDRQSVEQTILRYNDLLARGYAELNVGGLREVAIEDQIAKVYIHMAALGEGKVRMVSELKDMHILEVSFPSEDSAEARTKEIWNYSHINIQTNRVDKSVEGVVYRLSYELHRKNGKWFVSHVESIDEKKDK